MPHPQTLLKTRLTLAYSLIEEFDNREQAIAEPRPGMCSCGYRSRCSPRTPRSAYSRRDRGTTWLYSSRSPECSILIHCDPSEARCCCRYEGAGRRVALGVEAGDRDFLS